jgi:hypothetical protein
MLPSVLGSKPPCGRGLQIKSLILIAGKRKKRKTLVLMKRAPTKTATRQKPRLLQP